MKLGSGAELLPASLPANAGKIGKRKICLCGTQGLPWQGGEEEEVENSVCVCRDVSFRMLTTVNIYLGYSCQT